MLALLSEAQQNARPDNVPSWITDSSFPEEMPGRVRVGDGLTQRRLQVIDVRTGAVKPVDHGEVGIPTAETEEGGSCGGRSTGFGPAGLPGPIVSYSEDGTKAIFSARSQDNKTCWLFALDTAAGKARVLTKDEDKAWLGGPGGGQGWLGDNQTYYFTSERDGFNHLYEISYETGKTRQVTFGAFELDRVELSHDKLHFYLTSSQGSPAERNLWILDVSGGTPTRITKAVGMHAVAVSPDDKWIADVYSYTNKPPELYIQELQPEAKSDKLTTSPAPEFNNYPWLDTPIVQIPARDGAKIPGHLYKSAAYRRGGPAIIFVHGAGYLQNVHKGWSSAYCHEYLFHHFLMEHGYLILILMTPDVILVRQPEMVGQSYRQAGLVPAREPLRISGLEMWALKHPAPF